MTENINRWLAGNSYDRDNQNVSGMTEATPDGLVTNISVENLPDPNVLHVSYEDRVIRVIDMSHALEDLNKEPVRDTRLGRIVIVVLVLGVILLGSLSLVGCNKNTDRNPVQHTNIETMINK
jgi:hypothetical protein